MLSKFKPWDGYTVGGFVFALVVVLICEFVHRLTQVADAVGLGLMRGER